MKIIQSGKSKISEEVYRKLNGSLVNTIVHLNVFLNKVNHTKGLIGIIVDITRIKRTEKLLKIQRLKQKRLKTLFLKDAPMVLDAIWKPVYVYLNQLFHKNLKKKAYWLSLDGRFKKTLVYSVQFDKKDKDSSDEPKIIEVVYTLKEESEILSYPQQFSVLLNFDTGEKTIKEDTVSEE